MFWRTSVGTNFGQSALKVLSAKFNAFWKNVINVWASVKDDSSTAPEEILSQPIWHNGRIRVGGQPVFFSHWAKSGIFFINDLIKEDGSLLSLTDLKNNYNININFLDYYSIMLLIPQEWKSILRDNQIEKLDELCNKHILLLRVSQKVVKPFYKIFIQKVFEKPLKSQNKWMTDLNITEEENWDIIYQLPFKSILSTKLQSFQYKLYLRILYTNSMLMKCGLSETELCSYCFETKESICSFSLATAY